MTGSAEEDLHLEKAIIEERQPQRGGDKVRFLDSIRGIAALVVVVFHFFLGFYPEAFSAEGGGSFSFLERGVVRVLLNGTFAVDLFFVLSGFVLSLSFFRSFERKVLTSAAIRRYFRLLLPVFASVMIAWTIQANDGFRHVQAAERMQQPESSWLRTGAIEKVDFLGALSQGIMRDFFYYDWEKTLNTSLWSMEAELKGSFFVFAFLALCGSLSRRYLVYGALSVVFLVTQNQILLDFVGGVALCDWMMALRRQGKGFNLHWVWSAGLIVCGLVLGAVTANVIESGLGREIPFDERQWRPLAAALILLGVLGCPRFQRVLVWRPFLALGEISFSLYVIHWPVLISLGCAAYLFSRDWAWSHGMSVLMAGSVFFPVTLLLARGLYRFTDLPSIRLGKWVEKQVKG